MNSPDLFTRHNAIEIGGASLACGFNRLTASLTIGNAAWVSDEDASQSGRAVSRQGKADFELVRLSFHALSPQQSRWLLITKFYFGASQ